MARNTIVKEKKGFFFLKILLISGLISAAYFISGFFLVSDVGPLWTFYVYRPMIMTAMFVGFGGGSDSQLYTMLGIQFIILWIVIFVLLKIIRVIISFIKEILHQYHK